MLRWLIAAALSLVPASAPAAWRVATSNHFVVWAQSNDAATRAAAERLEKFHYVLRLLSQTTSQDSPIKVTVYLLPNEEAVVASMPFPVNGVAGYYETTSRGPFAVMSGATAGRQASAGDRMSTADLSLSSQQILLHELTHHFMFQYFPAAYPTWYSEGFADYIGSMRFGADDVVTLGDPVGNRYLSIQGNRWLPVQKLLTARNYADVPELDLLYAEGWLLVHYLSNTSARPGQLKAFLTAVNAGKPFDAAATAAFGDLDKLNRELQAYAVRSRLATLVLPFRTIDTGPVAVRAATPAEDALIGLDIRLRAGVPQRDAAALADRVERMAKAFPDDPYALSLVVEADRRADRLAAAAAATAHWLAVAPNDPLAVAAQADARADALVAAKSSDAAEWKEVRQLYGQSLKLAPAQPRTLQRFYATYRRQGVMPPESAQNALYTAYQMLPQNDELRHEVAADFEARGMIDAAIAEIRPVALTLVDPRELNPKQRAARERDRARYRLAGGADTESAREMLTRLEGKKAGQGAAGH